MRKKGMKPGGLKLSTKFSLAIGLIILVFCVIFSVLLYFQMKGLAIESANDKTLIILTQIDAVGDYIKNILRPKMYEIFSDMGKKDEFVVEALSTTHVTQEVMRRFNGELKDYIYMRVSDNPLNPRNKADSFHEGMMAYFKKNRDNKSWNGVIKKGGEEFLIRVKAITAERICLKCHGDPLNAPRGLVKKYSTSGGFNWREGDIVGVESVTIPLAATLGQIKGIAISTFIFGLATLLFLFISLQGAFWRLVSWPLNRLKTKFDGIVKGTEPLNKELPIEARDEVGEMTSSFNQMARHLYDAQERLKGSAETLHSIFEGISDPLALVKPDCSMEMTNQAYRDCAAKGVSAVFTEDCRGECRGDNVLCPACLLDRVKKEKSVVSEYWEGADGRYYHIHFYPIIDDEDKVIKAVQYVKDVTEKRQIEEQMRKAEKLAALGQLSAGVAHEINNPLGGIRLCFNNLMATSMDEVTRTMHIEMINSGLKRIQEIVKQLLDFSKQSSISVSPVSLNSLVENVLKLTEYLATKKRVMVIKKLSPDIPDIIADGSKIEQVFLNIMLNAIQSIDGSGGALTVGTSIVNGVCRVFFADTGCGIPEDALPYIFDPFFTTKPVGEGTGLGLSVSKSIVEQHNGAITVKTSAGGTTITVELPVKL